MGKSEVVKRLKDHLSYCRRHHGIVKRTDKEYCIRYIMDFLLIGRTEAKDIYECEVV